MTHLHQTEVFEMDALQAAEDIAEELGPEGCPDPRALGLSLLIGQNRLKQRLALEADDTTYADDVGRASAIVRRCGFTHMGRFLLEGIESGGEGLDYVDVYRHEASHAIATLETYGNHVNRIEVYFVSKAMPEKTRGLAYSGGYESVTESQWRRDPKFNDPKNWPQDIVLVASYSASDCFASRFDHLLECEPCPRPVAERFSIVDNVFITGRDIQAVEKRLCEELNTPYAPWELSWKRQAALALSRMTAMGLSAEQFGGPSKHL